MGPEHASSSTAPGLELEAGVTTALLSPDRDCSTSATQQPLESVTVIPDVLCPSSNDCRCPEISSTLEVWANTLVDFIGPSRESEVIRHRIFNYLRRTILDVVQATPLSTTRQSFSRSHDNPFAAEDDHLAPSFSLSWRFALLCYGSFPLKTYLPDGDIDTFLAVFNQKGRLEDARGTVDAYLDTLREKLTAPAIAQHKDYPIKNITIVEAEVRVLKLSVCGVAVDISVNQMGGCCSFVMLELFGHAFVKSNHLFKRSILLIKAWCTYDSRTLGSRNGLIASHALEVMLMCLFAVENPNSLRSPLHVLRRFLAYYATFDWDRYAVTAAGRVPLSSLCLANAEASTKAVSSSAQLPEPVAFDLLKAYADSKVVVAGPYLSVPLFQKIVDASEKPPENDGHSICDCSLEFEAAQLLHKQLCVDGQCTEACKFRHRVARFVADCQTLFHHCYPSYRARCRGCPPQASPVIGQRRPALPSPGLHDTLHNSGSGVLGDTFSGSPFIVRSMNIVDPLQRWNNLGRSVSVASLYRIREAFAYGSACLETAIETNTERGLAHVFKHTMAALVPVDLRMSILPLPKIWVPDNQRIAKVNRSASITASAASLDSKPTVQTLVEQAIQSRVYFSYVYPSIHCSIEEGIGLALASLLAELQRSKPPQNSRQSTSSRGVFEESKTTNAPSLQSYSSGYSAARHFPKSPQHSQRNDNNVTTGIPTVTLASSASPATVSLSQQSDTRQPPSVHAVSGFLSHQPPFYRQLRSVLLNQHVRSSRCFHAKRNALRRALSSPVPLCFSLQRMLNNCHLRHAETQIQKNNRLVPVAPTQNSVLSETRTTQTCSDNASKASEPKELPLSNTTDFSVFSSDPFEVLTIVGLCALLEKPSVSQVPLFPTSNSSCLSFLGTQDVPSTLPTTAAQQSRATPEPTQFPNRRCSVGLTGTTTGLSAREHQCHVKSPTTENPYLRHRFPLAASQSFLPHYFTQSVYPWSTGVNNDSAPPAPPSREQKREDRSEAPQAKRIALKRRSKYVRPFHGYSRYVNQNSAHFYDSETAHLYPAHIPKSFPKPPCCLVSPCAHRQSSFVPWGRPSEIPASCSPVSESCYPNYSNVVCTLETSVPAPPQPTNAPSQTFPSPQLHLDHALPRPNVSTSGTTLPSLSSRPSSSSSRDVYNWQPPKVRPYYSSRKTSVVLSNDRSPGAFKDGSKLTARHSVSSNVHPHAESELASGRSYFSHSKNNSLPGSSIS